MRWVAFAAMLLAMAAPAQAAWHKAESAHFVVYADDSERDVVRFAEILERYHGAMILMSGRQDSVPSPSNRVTIFAVGSASTIDKLVGQKNSQVAGFYLPRAGGSRAFVPNIRLTSGETDFSLTVPLHEYAHHFLMSTSRFAMPRWFNEGAAEFFASAKFERDGTVGIGRPAYHRAGELTYARDVTVEELLDHALYEKRHGKGFDAFYGRAWALYHYLFFDEARKGQLTAYVRAIASGKPEREAAVAVFGDLKKLEKELDSYLTRSRMTYFRVPPDKLPAPAVKVQALSAGEGAVMPLVIRSQRGVDEKEALKLVTELRAVAARFPDDAGVQTALAEAEYDAGNDAAAITAADRASARDPGRVNAYLQKGYALFRQASDAPGGANAASWRAAMRPFEALNKIENDHPLPLVYFHRSFGERGLEPSELARHALERASQLAPFDRGLAYQTALMHAGEGKIALAAAGLMVLAADPHGGELATEARKMAGEIGTLAEGTRWEGPQIAAIGLADVNGEDEGN